MKPFNSNHCS